MSANAPAGCRRSVNFHGLNSPADRCQAIHLEYVFKIRLHLRIKGFRITGDLEVVRRFLVTYDLLRQFGVAGACRFDLQLYLAASIQESKEEAGLVHRTAYGQETVIHEDGALFASLVSNQSSLGRYCALAVC